VGAKKPLKILMRRYCLLFDSKDFFIADWYAEKLGGSFGEAREIEISEYVFDFLEMPL